MKKVMDISIYRTNYGELYNYDDVVFGRVFLDNQYIEGVVYDSCSDHYSFVFGSFQDDDTLEIIETMQDVNELPKLMRVTSDQNNYYGDYFVTSRYIDYPLGECKMYLKDCTNITKNDVNILDTDIKKYKELMNDVSRDVYIDLSGDKPKVIKKYH